MTPKEFLKGKTFRAKRVNLAEPPGGTFRAVHESEVEELLRQYADQEVSKALSYNFKNSPIHDKRAIIDMMDNLEPKEMIKVVDFIKQQLEPLSDKPKLAEWVYCPECGCDKVCNAEGIHRQCNNCLQEYFTDLDYTDCVKTNLNRMYRKLSSPPSVEMLTDKQIASRRITSCAEWMMSEAFLESNDEAEDSFHEGFNEAISFVKETLSLLHSSDKNETKIEYCEGEAKGGHCAYGKSGNTCAKSCVIKTK